MRKAFVSISFADKAGFIPELAIIAETCKKNEFEPLIFVQTYSSFESNKQMMQQTMRDIESSDILIAEVSNKSIGVGIEVGYAKALNKPVIYLMKNGSEYSTTIGGMADYEIKYQNEGDLVDKLGQLLETIK